MAEAKPYSAGQERFGTVVIKVMSRVNTFLYRRTGGRIGGRFLRGAPVCVLTVTGRKSGEPRPVPLLYTRDGDDVLVVASKGGMSKHPEWYLNVLANPTVTIEIGRDTATYTARTASAEEKAERWPKLVATYKDYETYQARTDRDIPVIICTPV